MAEQFLNRLNKIEESINQLGETLKRMITILGTVTEIKSEVRVAKEEILQALSTSQSTTPISGPDQTDELAKMVVQEVGAVRVFVQQSMENLRNDVLTTIEEMISGIEIPQAPPTPAPTPPSARAHPPVEEEEYDTPISEPVSSMPPHKAMKVADELENIVNALKMGCIAGDVLEAMTEAKAAILKIVPSDPIMVRIDKWVGLVGSYPKRNELQARDIIKLKKDLKDEIPKYRPA